jgi:hypothetical protein
VLLCREELVTLLVPPGTPPARPRDRLAAVDEVRSLCHLCDLCLLCTARVFPFVAVCSFSFHASVTRLQRWP